MKERPIIFSTEMVKAILEGRKTQTRRVVTSKTSDIGEGGDWSKLCWDGSAVHTFPELTNYTPIKKQEKAPLPFVDDGFWEKDHSAAMYLHVPYNWEDDMTVYRVYCKYDVGDRLWVKETWCAGCANEPERCACYKVLDDGRLPKFFPSCRESVVKPSIFMPRWASRINLEITEIRVQRVQEITEEDARAEGVITCPNAISDYKHHFMILWNSLNAKPKPVYIRENGKKIISHYESYPWEAGERTETYRGKPHYIHGNPWVWIINFRFL